MKIAIVRGSYFNKFEMQNYEPLYNKFNIVGFSGLRSIHSEFKFPVKKLASPVDLPNFPLKMPILNRLFLGDAMYLFNLEKNLKGFDLVHTRETYFHFTQQALKAKRLGYIKKVVCTCSETIPFNHEGIWNRKKFKKRAIKEVDKFHCLTQKAKECLLREGCDPKKITVFPYGVDLKSFKPLGMNHKFDIFRLLFVGRFVKEKGIYDLLKILFLLLKSGKKVKLVMVGKGPEKSKIISLINQSEYGDDIEFKTVDYKDMAKEYQEANLLCLLSKKNKFWEEYFGMVLIEAMASGLPVLTTKSGGIPEVVGNAGILIKPGDYKTGFREVVKLIDQKDYYFKKSQESLVRAQNLFDSNEVARNIEKLWKS